MRLDETERVAGFLERPQTAEALAMVRTEPAWFEGRGVPSHGRDCLASTGIYLFERSILVKRLEKTDDHDFGKVFPAAIRSSKVQVHLFDGCWEDIGTIKAFYKANLEAADRVASRPRLGIASGRFLSRLVCFPAVWCSGDFMVVIGPDSNYWHSRESWANRDGVSSV